jgi:putative transposase
VLSRVETAAMFFWALMGSGKITMRRVDRWQSLDEKQTDQLIDHAA